MGVKADLYFIDQVLEFSFERILISKLGADILVSPIKFYWSIIWVDN